VMRDPGRRGAVFQMGADAGGNSEQDSYRTKFTV
jgi:hypothetical protein